MPISRRHSSTTSYFATCFCWWESPRQLVKDSRFQRFVSWARGRVLGSSLRRYKYRSCIRREVASKLNATWVRDRLYFCRNLPAAVTWARGFYSRGTLGNSRRSSLQWSWKDSPYWIDSSSKCGSKAHLPHAQREFWCRTVENADGWSCLCLERMCVSGHPPSCSLTPYPRQYLFGSWIYERRALAEYKWWRLALTALWNPLKCELDQFDSLKPG